MQELHADGVAAIEIARRLGVAQSTVHYHLRRQAAKTETPDLVEPPESVATRRLAPRGEIRTREAVEQLLGEGLRRSEIAARLGINRPTVSYHARQLGAPIDERCRRRYDWAAVQEFYDEGHTVRECATRFGFSLASWHAASKRGLLAARRPGRSFAETFAPGTHRNRGQLKRRLIREGHKDGRCELCGISDWMRRPLVLALHHRNGDRLDNRVENLQLLCPNCHSQTESFGGRNGARRPRAS